MRYSPVTTGLPTKRAHYRADLDLLLSPRPFTELLLPISCLQFHHLSKVLGPAQTRRKIEAGIDVTLSNVDEPADSAP